MKRFTSLKSLLAVALLAAAGGVTAQENLFSDGGFETWEGGKPVGWQPWQPSNPSLGDVTVTQSSDARTGNSCAKVETSKSGTKYFSSSDLKLKAGTYVVSAWVKATDTRIRVRIAYAYAIDGEIQQGDYVFATSNEWVEVTGTFTLEADSTLINLVIMIPKTTSGTTNLLVDDVSLTTEDGGIIESTKPEREGKASVTVSGATVTLTDPDATASEIVTTTDLGTFGWENASHPTEITDSVGTTIIFANGGGSTKPMFFLSGGGHVNLVPGSLMVLLASKPIAKVVLNCYSVNGTDYVGTSQVYVGIRGNMWKVVNGKTDPQTDLDIKTIEITYAQDRTWKPSVTVDSASVSFGKVSVNTYSMVIVSVKGTDLTGDLTVALSGDDVFTSEVTSIAQKYTADAGIDVTFAPTEARDYSGKLTISGGGLTEDVEIALSGRGIILSGQGTQDAPYTVADVQDLGNPKTESWVKGYIVGFVRETNEDAFFTAEGDSVADTNFLIADDAAEKNYAKCLPVQLPKGKVRDALNLQDNPGNLGKPVALKGTLDAYFGICGLKSVTEYLLDVNVSVGGIEAGNAGVPTEVYTLGGVKVGDSIEGLQKGIYVVKQGGTVKKVLK